MKMELKLNNAMIVLLTINVAIFFPGFITGTVTNAVNTSQPIQGAIVNVTGAATATATTDAAGLYIIPIASGTYTLNAGAAGFLSNTTTITVTSGETTTQNFALQQIVARGDVSGNGAVDITDALFIAQSTVGLRTLDVMQLVAADVNTNSRVDITDALFIAQFTVGLRTL